MEIRAHMRDFAMPCFVDKEYWTANNDHIFPIDDFDPLQYKVLIAVGNPADRQKIFKTLPENTRFFSFIHPTAQILGNDIAIGEGSIVCAGSILTTNIVIGKHAHLNLHSTIGHDCRIGDFFTTGPGAKISGKCIIGDRVYVGTNASIREKLSICDDVTVGLNTGIVKSIGESGVYVGAKTMRLG